MTAFLRGLLGVLLLVVIAGCSGGGSSDTSAITQLASGMLVGIEVTPGSPAIAIGTTVHLVATGIYSDNTKKDITSSVAWTSSNSAAATVSNSGVVSAVGQGSATITATLGTILGSTDLTVTPVTLASISVTPANPKIAAGVSKQFTATGIFSDSSIQDLTNEVTWSSSNAAVAIMASTAQSGLVKMVTPGSAIITATLGANSGSATLTVTSATLISIDLTPAIPVIAAGTTQQFVATGTFSDDTVEDLTASAAWTSSKPAVASVGNTGQAAGVAPGTTTIAANFGGVSGSTDLTVTSANLESIDLYLDYDSTPIGVPQQCTASGNYSDGTVQDLTSQVIWNSSDNGVASVSNASGSNGMVVSVGAGATSISATLGGVSGSTTLTVTPAYLVSIATTPVTGKIALGTTMQFSATGTASDGKMYELTPYASWTSSNPAVATLSNAAPTNGIATSVGIGTTSVKATWGGMASTSSLTVVSATLAGMAITPADSVSHLGAPQQMTAIATFTDNDGNSWPQDLTTQVTWKSSTRSIVAISNAPGFRGLATPLKVGTVTITAVFNGVAASTGMTVSSARLTSITITPADITIAVGTRMQLIGTGTYDDGYTGDVTKMVKWTSSDKSIASVINNPRKRRAQLRGVNTGTATITAVLRGVSGSATVTVN